MSNNIENDNEFNKKISKLSLIKNRIKRSSFYHHYKYKTALYNLVKRDFIVKGVQY